MRAQEEGSQKKIIQPLRDRKRSHTYKGLEELPNVVELWGFKSSLLLATKNEHERSDCGNFLGDVVVYYLILFSSH